MTITPADALDLRIAQGPPQQDLGGQIAKLPDSYWAGLDEAYKRRNQNAFAGGIPTDAKGDPDWGKISATLLQQGGVPGAPVAVETGKLDIQRQQEAQDRANAVVRSGGQPEPSAPAPAMAPPPTAPSAPYSNQIPGGDSGQTIMGAVVPHFGEGSDAGRVALVVANRLGIQNPNATLPPDKFQAAQDLTRKLAESRQPQPPTNPGNNAPVTRPATSAQPINDPNSPYPPGVDPVKYERDLEIRSATGTKEGRELNQKKLDAIAEWKKARSGIENAARTKEGEATVTSLGKLTDAGVTAAGHIGQLDAITDLGKKVGYGVIPKVQSFLGKYGIETKGLTDIQAYERAIDAMAPQLRPIGSGRLLQNELNSFKSALGGLMTTPEGREISLNNLRLLSRYQIQVGEIANDTSLTANERMTKILSTPPPRLQTQIPRPVNRPATAARPQFSNPTEVHQAVEAGLLRRGDTFMDSSGTPRRVP